MPNLLARLVAVLVSFPGVTMQKRRSVRQSDADAPPGKRAKRTAAIRASDAWRLDVQDAGADLVFGPALTPRAAVIWLHGLDDAPESWAERLVNERHRRPEWKWVHLRAPERPITCYQKMRHSAWGDFVDEGAVRVGSRDHESRDPKGWYAASVARVHEAVELLAAEGVPPARVAIVGFSQGAALAAEAALTLRPRLAGFALLAGWLSPRARQAVARGANGRSGARVLVAHSTADEQVDYGCALLAERLLAEAGAGVRFEELNGVMHVAGEAQLKSRALTFLDEVLEGGGGGFVPRRPQTAMANPTAAAAAPPAAGPPGGVAAPPRVVAPPRKLPVTGGDAASCPACRGQHRAHTCGRQREAKENVQPAAAARAAASAAVTHAAAAAKHASAAAKHSARAPPPKRPAAESGDGEACPACRGLHRAHSCGRQREAKAQARVPTAAPSRAAGPGGATAAARAAALAESAAQTAAEMAALRAEVEA